MKKSVNVNFRMDSQLKKDMENICSELGISMTSAFTMFAKKVTREMRIPFDISIDPFYSKSNINHLHRGIKALNNGEGKEHELIEIE